MSSGGSQKYVKVTIDMVDGNTFVGELGCGLLPKIENALHSAANFVELISEETGSRFISKAQIVTIAAVKE